MTMDTTRWLSMPQQVEAQLARWQHDYPDSIAVDAIVQYTGLRCLALTIGDDAALRGSRDRPTAWFCVPHAHEPAGTAAIVDVIHQLLTGRDLAGQPAAFDYRSARRRLTLVFNPDANPGGRTWSPVLWWDGSRYSHEEMLQWNRGIDPATGGVWQRVNRWSVRGAQPLRRGIAYEQVNEHEFVEPNRDPGSSLVRLFRKMHARHNFGWSLHLHQAQTLRSQWNCYTVLPVSQPELPATLQEANRAWAAAIVERWVSAGGRPDPVPRQIDEEKNGDTVSWFRAEAGAPFGQGANRGPRPPAVAVRRVEAVVVGPSDRPVVAVQPLVAGDFLGDRLEPQDGARRIGRRRWFGGIDTGRHGAGGYLPAAPSAALYSANLSPICSSISSAACLGATLEARRSSVMRLTML